MIKSYSFSDSSRREPKLESCTMRYDMGHPVLKQTFNCTKYLNSQFIIILYIKLITRLIRLKTRVNVIANSKKNLMK